MQLPTSSSLCCQLCWLHSLAEGSAQGPLWHIMQSRVQLVQFESRVLTATVT